MNKNNLIVAGLFAFAVISFISVSNAYAHPHLDVIQVNEHTHEPQTEIIPINAQMGLEKTTVSFHASSENTLPWAYVEGKIVNHVSNYPVIIQMFSDGDPAHFAQTDVSEDGSYEYKFRVLNVDNGETIRAFEGDYTVVIFKVVYLQNSNLV